MHDANANDDFERRRLTGRLLSRIQGLSLAAFMLSVVPGLPGLDLARSVAFQDQWGWFDVRLALGCLLILCAAGLVGAVVAGGRREKVNKTQLTEACSAIALSGTPETGFNGTWSERRVRLSYATPAKATPYLDLEIWTKLDLPLHFIGRQDAVATAIEAAASYRSVEGLDPVYDGLRVITDAREAALRDLLRRESVARVVRGALAEWLGPAGYLRFEKGTLCMRSAAPDLLELSADRAISLRADLTKLIDLLASIVPAAPGQQAPAGRRPELSAARIVRAGLASTMFGIHSAVGLGALAIFLAAIPAAFVGSQRYPTLEALPCVMWACVFAIPLTVASIAIWRRFRHGAPPWYHVVAGGLALLGVPIFAYALVVWCNGALDSSEPRSHEARLVQKHTRPGGRGTRSQWIEVSSWRDARKSERIRVPEEAFASWNRGDTVIVSTRRGALRMEYWTRIATRVDAEAR